MNDKYKVVYWKDEDQMEEFCRTLQGTEAECQDTFNCEARSAKEAIAKWITWKDKPTKSVLRAVYKQQWVEVW